MSPANPGRPRSDAVTAALTANGRDLLAFAERRIGRDDAPDVVAEVMVVAWRRANDVPADPTEARMWLFGVARGVVANATRGHVRRSRLASRLREVTASGPQAQGAPADHGLTVRDAIDRLEPDQAEIVRLVHWEGLTLAEAAGVLAQPATTVRSRYARARAALSIALDPAGNTSS